MKAAMEGFATVTGLAAADMKDMLLHIPFKTTTWKENLMTWKNVKKGRDLFLNGLGGFPINQVYNELVTPCKYWWAINILEVFKAPPLHRAYKLELKARQKCEMNVVSSPATSKNDPRTVDEIKEILVSLPNFNIFKFFKKEAPSGFKKGELSPLPPFIEYGWETLSGLEYFRGRVNLSCLNECLYTGAGCSRVFRLPSVHEVQTLGYFSTAMHANGMNDSVLMLSMILNILASGEKSPQWQHLIWHSHFWNKPDNIGSIDKIEQAACDSDAVWP